MQLGTLLGVFEENKLTPSVYTSIRKRIEVRCLPMKNVLQNVFELKSDAKWRFAIKKFNNRCWGNKFMCGRERCNNIGNNHWVNCCCLIVLVPCHGASFIQSNCCPSFGGMRYSKNANEGPTSICVNYLHRDTSRRSVAGRLSGVVPVCVKTKPSEKSPTPSIVLSESQVSW